MIKKEHKRSAAAEALLEDLLANEHNHYNDIHAPVPAAHDDDWETGRAFARWRLRQTLAELEEKYKREHQENK